MAIYNDSHDVQQRASYSSTTAACSIQEKTQVLAETAGPVVNNIVAFL